MDVKDLVVKHGLHDKDIVNVVKGKYPRYDKYIHSKVKRPEEYGIKLVGEAEQLLQDTFKPDHTSEQSGQTTSTISVPVKRRKDNRQKPCRVQCRLSKERYGALQQALKADGYDTMQDGLDSLITQYLILNYLHKEG